MDILSFQKSVRPCAGLFLALLGARLLAAVAPMPVEFSFEPAAGPVDPFAREVFADVITPSEKTLRLPAFYAGGKTFLVRARAEEPGEYRLGAISEITPGGKRVVIEARRSGEPKQWVKVLERRPQVTIGPERPARFVFAGGGAYVPIGANLAWATDVDRAAWYGKAFREFGGAGLNWARVWMANWGGLDLDWLPEDLGKSPPPGQLDERVAKNWDAVIAGAEEQGVYLQVVLQHHGQFSTQVNANWAGHPWNEANAGGFLRTPGEFFTSPEARRLTKQKYRTIVARWGYSPTVLAWELFNEVHWVDALRLERNGAAVAKWHDAMAAYLRSIDVYGHLVTTSTEDLASPIYRSMDYLQPHLYATAMLAAARRFDPLPAGDDRLVFYGEQGDDHMRYGAEQRDAGIEIGPVTWASLMGGSRYPAQPWEGDQMLGQGRLGELRAVARFLQATALGERNGLTAFSPALVGEATAPLVVEGGDKWHRRPLLDLRVPADGRQAIEFALVPGILVGSPKSLAEGYPDQFTLRVNYREAATATLRIADVGRDGAVVRVEVDGKNVAERSMFPPTANAEGRRPRAAELSFALTAGEHAIVIRNVGRKDWLEFEALDLGLKTSPLAAIGRRGEDFIVAWIWNRRGILSLLDVEPAAGTVEIEEVPAGKWHLTWWDSVAGLPGPPTLIEHAGGVLELPTPPIRRHAAVVLSR